MFRPLFRPRLGSGQELPEPYFPPSMDVPSLASRTPENVMVLEVVLAQAQPPAYCLIPTCSSFLSSTMRQQVLTVVSGPDTQQTGEDDGFLCSHCCVSHLDLYYQSHQCLLCRFTLFLQEKKNQSICFWLSFSFFSFQISSLATLSLVIDTLTWFSSVNIVRFIVN